MVIDMRAIRLESVEMLWFRWSRRGEWVELGTVVYARAGDDAYLFSAIEDR